MEIKDKIFVVTGAGNGIGRQVALLCLYKGATVVGLDIDKTGLQQTVEMAGNMAENAAEKLSTYICDITDREKVTAVAREIIKKHKTIDGLLNVAGIIQPFIKIDALSYDKIEQVMNINFYGTVNMVKTYLPYLQKATGTAVIGNVSSMGGFLPVPGQSVYGASKAAVKLFTEALYAELLKTNVRVCSILPGAVATNIVANSGVEMKQANETKQTKAAKTKQ
ncbi:MAG: SDR family oxidoreductase, partial [Christensenellaceae bacterium]|nr:SDR family oxidoreductase [Christensenellaceae bacterium]